MSATGKSKFQQLPAKRARDEPERDKQVSSFIAAAEAKATIQADERWSAHDDGRLFPGFSLRYNDRERAKLKFAAGAVGLSMHDFCRQVIFDKVAEVIDQVDQGRDPRSAPPFDRLRK